MAYDLVDQSQLYLRRAGQLLRSRGVLPADDAPRRCLDEAARDRNFDRGDQQIADLAAEIEAHTGCTLQGRRALDFGCGFGRLALPLAERCEYVYGVDVSPEVLREADRNARRMKLDNVEWMETDRLAELSGLYDMVLSHWVFAHIPSREGERTFATLLRGLAPGGIGAIHVTIRPNRPLARLFRSSKSSRFPYNPLNLVRGLDWSYGYLLMNSYSLNRLGGILADAGVNKWLVKWHADLTPDTSGRPYPSVTIIFRKD